MLVEAMTYRFRGHSMADPESYRTKEEVEAWRERDPIQGVREAAGARPGSSATSARAARRRGGRSASTRRSSSPTARPCPAPESAVRRRLRARRRGQGLALDRPAGGGGADERAALPGGAQPGAARGDAARRAVFLMGEDIGVFDGAFKVTDGLLDEFGERRVRDTPISENTIVGVGRRRGDARPAAGRRADDDQLLAAGASTRSSTTPPHIHYMFGGQARVPLVIRMPQGAGHQLGPTHSHCFEALYLHVPGLLVAVPSTPADAKRPAEGGDPRRQPGHLHRARVALRRCAARCPTTTTPASHFGQARGRARGHRRDDRRHLADGAAPPSARPSGSATSTGSRPR